MPTKPLTDAQCQQALDGLDLHGGSVAEAARELGLSWSAYNNRLSEARRRGLTAAGFTPVSLPTERLPTDELLTRRKRQFEKKRDYEEAAKLIKVQVRLEGPVGILHFGDPHLDDDGTDITQLERHVELVRRTEGLFGANVGDTLNNWTGRLARLYAQQSTSAAEAWQLAEWFLTRIPWLYIIAGNHDLWSGEGDPIRWIAAQSNTLYKSSEVRINLAFPNGAAVRVNARHDFAGHSQYNPAHGAMKALMFGTRDHLAVAGHRHVSGHGMLKCPHTGIAMHALQVASYKIYDRYAKEKGFRDQSFSPCAITLIDPALPTTHPDLVKVYWDPEEGAEVLKWKRSRFERKKTAAR